MKEFQNIANKAVESYLSSGKLEEKINTSIEKCFNDCIDSSFSYGKLRDSIRNVIEKKVVISLDDIDIQSYNQVMLEALKGQMAKYTNSQALEGFNSVLTETFGEAPKEIHIDEIVNKILADWKSEDPCDCNDDKTATIELEKHDKYSNTSYSLKITDGEKYGGNRHHLYFLEDRIRISHNQELNPTLLRGVEGFLFKLYSARTKILGLEDFDEDDFDLDLNFDHDY